MVQNTTRDADWTVCDGAFRRRGRRDGIAGRLTDGGERASALPADDAVLVRNESGPNAGTWLLWNGQPQSRSTSPTAPSPTHSASGADVPAPRPIAPGLFNAIPEASRADRATDPGCGRAAQLRRCPSPRRSAPSSPPTTPTTRMRHYAVLAEGLQPISPVLAAILRNTNSYGLDQPPRLGADEVARAAVVARHRHRRLPGRPRDPRRRRAAPLTCARWTKPADATGATLTLLSGAALPLADGRRTVDLVGAGSGTTANRVALAPGTRLPRPDRRSRTQLASG